MFLLRETGHPCSNANSNASIENIDPGPLFIKPILITILQRSLICLKLKMNELEYEKH